MMYSTNLWTMKDQEDSQAKHCLGIIMLNISKI